MLVDEAESERDAANAQARAATVARGLSAEQAEADAEEALTAAHCCDQEPAVTLWPSESPQPKPPRQTYVERWKAFAA